MYGFLLKQPLTAHRTYGWFSVASTLFFTKNIILAETTQLASPPQGLCAKRYVQPRNTKLKPMKYLDRLLEVPSDDRNTFQILLWWELRRILYNIIVLAFGIICLMIISAIVNVRSGEDLVEPLAIIGFGILCNLGYSLGWLTEIFRKKDKKYGPKMFKIGLRFTLFFVFLPLAIHFVLWIFRGFKTMY